MTHIELRTKVGPDGVLALSVPVGMSEANQEVKVVVESVAPRSTMTQEEWQKFIAETAGSWEGEFERPEQGEFEKRDEWP
jgi:hypothetical protein